MSKEKSLSDELREGLRKKWQSFIAWLKPDPQDNIALQVLKFILKIPVLLLVIALSPVVLIVLVFAFVIAI